MAVWAVIDKGCLSTKRQPERSVLIGPSITITGGNIFDADDMDMFERDGKTDGCHLLIEEYHAMMDLIFTPQTQSEPADPEAERIMALVRAFSER